jgi:hypothetical protein
MPTLLLREHLKMLHEELVQAVPERARSYGALVEVTSVLPPEPTGPVLQNERELAPEHGISPREALSLVRGAVCDEHAGYAKALPALLVWLADPGRFSEPWVQAMRSAADEANLR